MKTLKDIFNTIISLPIMILVILFVLPFIIVGIISIEIEERKDKKN